MILFGLVSYQDRVHLEKSLPALFAIRNVLLARGENVEIVLQDNARDAALQEWLRADFPDLIVQESPRGNLGYGAGYNAILKTHPGSEIFGVVTSDVILDVEPTLKLLDAFRAEPRLVQAAGKLVTAQDPHCLDSAGIWATKAFHFSELGSGQKDGSHVDAALDKILGISGAAFLIRTSAIEHLHGSADCLFTPHFWMYKEDIDLALRLREQGLLIRVENFIWGVHVRTAFNREGQDFRHIFHSDLRKKNWIRTESYKNHLLLLKMHPPLRLGWGVFLKVVSYELMKAVYLFFTHPKTLFFGLRGLLFSPVKRSSMTVSQSELRSFFH